MKNAKYLVLSVSMLVLISCATAPVTDENLPTADIAENWRANEKTSEYVVGEVRDGWLDVLNIPALSVFVHEVLEKNPDFQATSHRMKAAGFNAEVSRGNLYPTLNANFGASRQHISNPDTTGNNLSLGLDARWEADVWGRLSARVGAADADYAAARYDREGARLSLAAQVTQGWFDIMEAEEQATLAAKTVESYERAAGVVKKRFVRGLSTGLDLRLIVTSLEASRANLSNRENQLEQEKRRLEILAGRYPAAKIMAKGEIPDLKGDVPIGLPINLLERRPDLRAAKERLISVGYSSQAAEKNLLPSFSITASGNNSSSNFSDLLKFDNIFWNLLGNITQPLFQGGKLRYTAKAQLALFEAEKQVFARNLLVAFKEVEDALSSERSLKEQVNYIEKAAENAASAENVAIDQFARGLIKISVLLESQRQSLAQQSQLISVKKQLINNRIALHLALGGDFITSEDIQAQTNNRITPQGKADKGNSL
ncbi:MAG: efflux transporter outer membrane subunit [Emcibacter sp.]|nr:efflux transporter outer membrane subunit [Emcibacter sp.]